MPSGPPTVHNDLRRINQSAQHLRSLVSDVIELSRGEAGRATLDLREFDVDEVVSEVT